MRENIDAVRNLIEEDRHVTYREIEISLSISMTSIHKILHEHLGVRKLCARWFPHLLTDGQKRARVDWCRKTISKYNCGASKAVYSVVTGDESWIYAYEPEKKANRQFGCFNVKQSQQKLFVLEALRSKWWRVSSRKPVMWQLWLSKIKRPLIQRGIRPSVCLKFSVN